MVPAEPQSAGANAAEEDESLLDQLIPQLALAAVCFAAGALVGYQYGMTHHLEQPASGTSEEEGAVTEADWTNSRTSAAQELRTSGAAAAGAIHREAEAQSQGRLYASADAKPAPTPDSKDSAETSLPAGSTVQIAAGLGGERQPSEGLTHELEAGPSEAEDLEGELPFVHMPTPRSNSKEEAAASPRTPALSTPETSADWAGSSVPCTDAASRRDPDTGAAESFDSTCSSLEERVAQSGECSTSGRGTVGFVHVSETPSLQRLRWAMGGEAGQWPQLEHWDEATAFWGAFSRQLNVRQIFCSEPFSTTIHALL